MNIFNQGTENDQNNLVAEVHKVLIKLYNDPTIIQLISDKLYDSFDQITKFAFDQSFMSFEITISKVIAYSVAKSIVTNVFLSTITSTLNLDCYRYTYGHVYDQISNISVEGLADIISRCVTVLVLPGNDISKQIIKINLHN